MPLSFKMHQTIHQGIHQLTFEIGSKQLFLINKSDDSFGTDTEKLTSSDKLLLELKWQLANVLQLVSAQRETAATSLEVLLNMCNISAHLIIAIQEERVSQKLQPEYSYRCQKGPHMVNDKRPFCGALESCKGSNFLTFGFFFLLLSQIQDSYLSKES